MSDSILLDDTPPKDLGRRWFIPAAAAALAYVSDANAKGRPKEIALPKEKVQPSKLVEKAPLENLAHPAHALERFERIIHESCSLGRYSCQGVAQQIITAATIWAKYAQQQNIPEILGPVLAVKTLPLIAVEFAGYEAVMNPDASPVLAPAKTPPDAWTIEPVPQGQGKPGDAQPADASKGTAPQESVFKGVFQYAKHGGSFLDVVDRLVKFLNECEEIRAEIPIINAVAGFEPRFVVTADNVTVDPLFRDVSVQTAAMMFELLRSHRDLVAHCPVYNEPDFPLPYKHAALYLHHQDPTMARLVLNNLKSIEPVFTLTNKLLSPALASLEHSWFGPNSGIYTLTGRATPLQVLHRVAELLQHSALAFFPDKVGKEFALPAIPPVPNNKKLLAGLGGEAPAEIADFPIPPKPPTKIPSNKKEGASKGMAVQVRAAVRSEVRSLSSRFRKFVPGLH